MESKKNRYLFHGLMIIFAAIYPANFLIHYFFVEKTIGHFFSKYKECRSKFCYTRNNFLPTGFCTTDCKSDSDCTGSHICRLTCSGRFCMNPPDKLFAERCMGPEDCISGICLGVFSRPDGYFFHQGFCSVDCGENNLCPENSFCPDDYASPEDYTSSEGYTSPACVPESSIADKEKLYVESSKKLGVRSMAPVSDKKKRLLQKLGHKPSRKYKIFR